ncbi:MAG TPA: ATP-dependent helicase [Coleofasciculaceae cyanobacterium]|jgi:superfamily I DNA/RNA helicase
MIEQLGLFAQPPSLEKPDVAVTSYLDGLNPQQLEAVLTPSDQPLQVLAGAGTGKTELISRRFIKLVKDFLSKGISRPEERILVVTFTNDAALSMRQRIHQRLIANGEEGLRPDCWISTFHQFCMRLLRSHPLEIGLAPDFSILNSLEQQVLFNRMMHGVLAGDQPDIQPAMEKADLSAQLPENLLSLAALEKAGLGDIEALLESGRIFHLINRIKTSGLSPREFLETASQQAWQFTERLKTLPVPHDKDLKTPENMELKVSAWRDALRPWAHADWNPVKAAEYRAETTGKKLTASVYKEEVKGLVALYLAGRTFEPITPDFNLLDDALAQELSVIRIVTALYALYQEALLKQGACDFDDLINHTVTLLTRYPALRERYRRQFEAIIVDEFQDSNGSQLRLLELLMRDGARNLTVVGDAKQSIYAFRFAQPENLDLIFRNSDCKRVNLQINYRSRPPVLGVANRLTDRITARPNQCLSPSEKNSAHTEPKVICLNLDEAFEEDGKLKYPAVSEQKALEAHYIAVEIARLVREEQVAFSDIAVLVKSHAKAEDIQKTLAGFNIPAIRQKNLGFFQESVIKDAMALLRLMRNLSDDLSFVRILQGKLNQKQIRDLMQLRRRLHETQEAASLFETCLLLHGQPDLLPELPSGVALAVGDLAVQLMEARKLKPRLAPVQLFLQLARRVGLIDRRTPEWQHKQQRITLRTFERLLYLFSQNQPLQPTLDEVIETLEQYAADPSQELPVTEELSGEDAVRIMTVFAAKGLEFPVVFACYTEKGQVSKGGGDTAITFDPQYPGKAGFGLMLGQVNGLPNPKLELYRKCWQTPRSATEAQRVFYVALTRAMEHLYMIRCSQSFPWTAPEEFSPEDLLTVSGTDDADHLYEHYWNADAAQLREEMAKLQEARKAAASAKAY